jgi:hypothetical protein
VAERANLARLSLLASLVLAGAILVVTLLPRFGGQQGTGQPGSSFATADEGAKAAFLLLERLGHKVVRRTQPLADLGASRLAFLLAPQTRFERMDGAQVRAWLEEGGTLVYGVAPFEPAAETLRGTLELPAMTVVPTARTVVQLEKDWAPARTLVIHSLVAGRAFPSEVTPVALRGDTPVALVVKKGKGQIYLIDARVFSNGGLKEGDNALFLAVLAARHGGGAVLSFDEFAHGFGDVVSVLGAIAWPLKLALAGAALALLLYALAIGRRLGVVSPDPTPPRRASTEQIEALAGFYAGKHDRHTALLALAAGLGDDSRAPLVPPANDKDFLAAAQKLRAVVTTKDTKGTAWP